MADTQFRPDDSALRRGAENDICAGTAAPEEPLSCAETIGLVHELQVHQIELQAQNRELSRIAAELESSRARYFEHYDLAPVGYFTLSEKGVILEANLTVAVWLGVGKSDLVNQPLTCFIFPEDRDIFYRHRQQLLATHSPQVCELRLARKDAASFWVRLDAGATGDDENGATVCRVVVTAISERKMREREMERLNRL